MSNSRLQEVEQEIKIVNAQKAKAKMEVLKARADCDNKEMDFLEAHFELHEQLSALQEEHKIIVQAQAPGQFCLPCCNCLKAHTLVCAHSPLYDVCLP